MGLGSIESTRKEMALPEDMQPPMGILIELPENMTNTDPKYIRPKKNKPKSVKKWALTVLRSLSGTGTRGKKLVFQLKDTDERNLTRLSKVRRKRPQDSFDFNFDML